MPLWGLESRDQTLEKEGGMVSRISSDGLGRRLQCVTMYVCAIISLFLQNNVSGAVGCCWRWHSSLDYQMKNLSMAVLILCRTVDSCLTSRKELHLRGASCFGREEAWALCICWAVHRAVSECRILPQGASVSKLALKEGK